MLFSNCTRNLAQGQMQSALQSLAFEAAVVPDTAGVVVVLLAHSGCAAWLFWRARCRRRDWPSHASRNEPQIHPEHGCTRTRSTLRWKAGTLRAASAALAVLPGRAPLHMYNVKHIKFGFVALGLLVRSPAEIGRCVLARVMAHISPARGMYCKTQPRLTTCAFPQEPVSECLQLHHAPAAIVCASQEACHILNC